MNRMIFFFKFPNMTQFQMFEASDSLLTKSRDVSVKVSFHCYLWVILYLLQNQICSRSSVITYIWAGLEGLWYFGTVTYSSNTQKIVNGNKTFLLKPLNWKIKSKNSIWVSFWYNQKNIHIFLFVNLPKYSTFHKIV